MATKSEWMILNDTLRSCDLLTAEKMLDEEIMSKHRKQFMLRIHSRVNVLRAAAEREELIRHALGK